MKRTLTAAVMGVALVAAAFAASGSAQTAPPSWPPGKMQVFVAANTVTATDGQQSNVFARGATVVFHAYAVDLKTKKVLTGKDVKYFYAVIPGQPNVKFAWGTKGLWTGTWTVPSTYALGVVDFRILVKTNAKRYGAFYQVPVSNAQLTVVP